MNSLIIKFNKASEKNFLLNLYFALLGFFGFSHMGYYVLMEKFHFHFYLVELFFLPLFFIDRRYFQYLKKVMKRKYCILFFLILTYDIICGVVYTSDLINVITMSRSLVYLFVVTFIFLEKKCYSINKLYIISFWAVLGDIYYSIFLNASSISSVNTIAIALIILISAIQERFVLVVLSFFVGLVASILSGCRLGIVLTIMVIIEVIFWLILKKNNGKSVKKRIQSMIYVVVGIFLLILSIISFNKFVFFLSEKFNMDPYAIYRVTSRLKNLLALNFEATGDVGRIEQYSLIFTQFIPRLFPRGLVGKSLGPEVLGLYIDVPIIYFYDAFGSIISIALLCNIFIKGIYSFLCSFKNKWNYCYTLCGLMFPVFLLHMIVNGSFLYYTYEVILTALIVSMWILQWRKRNK